MGDGVNPLGKVVAVVVTYNPEPGLAQRMERVLPQVDHLVVVDNASRAPPVDDVASLGSKASLIRNEANLGIGEALNIGCRAALAHGAKWALLLDDDSLVEPDLVRRYGELLAESADRDRIALVGCNFWDINRGRLGLDPLEFRARLGPSPFVMTSGSILRLSAFQKAGPMRGDFFIDCIDFEYGLRMEAAGFLSMLTSEVLMEHTLGKPARHRFPPKECSHHSVARKYYWVRNRSVMLQEYREKLPHRIGLVRGGIAKQVIHTLLHDTQKLLRLKAIRLAVRDARRGRLGPAPSSLQRLGPGER